MKYSKQLLATIPLVTFIMYPYTLYAAPYLCLQTGVANEHPVNVWVSKKSKYIPTGRISAGVNYGLIDQFKIGMEVGAYKRKSITFGFPEVTSQKWIADGMGLVDLYLTKHFDVVGKAGIAFVHPRYRVKFIQAEGNSTSYNFSSKSYFVPKIEFGVGYNICDKINLNVSTYHEFSKNQNKGMTSFVGGIRYEFL